MRGSGPRNGKKPKKKPKTKDLLGGWVYCKVTHAPECQLWEKPPLFCIISNCSKPPREPHSKCLSVHCLYTPVGTSCLTCKTAGTKRNPQEFLIWLVTRFLELGWKLRSVSRLEALAPQFKLPWELFIKASRSGKTNNNKGTGRKRDTFCFSKPVIYIFPRVQY